MAAGTFSFTKLIVGDLDKTAEFYKAVCGLTEENRITAEVEGRAITEIIMGSTSASAATLVLLAYHDTPKPAAGESILGFFTADLGAFVDRAQKAGGSLMQAAKDLPEMGMKVAFVRDNEGHVIEALQRL